MVRAFEEIKQWMEAAEKAQPIERTDCPEDGYTLTKHRKTGQLHCPFCGWPHERREGY